MMNSEQYREHIERTFNAFCKIVLYHAALGIYKKIRRKQQFEVSLDYLREFDFEPIATTDEYFVKYDMPTTFTVRGETVIVESEQLAAALLRLPEKRREVLFLRYYLGYSDTEIGRLFGVCRSTIFRRRKRSLRFIRKEFMVSMIRTWPTVLLSREYQRRYSRLPQSVLNGSTTQVPL